MITQTVAEYVRQLQDTINELRAALAIAQANDERAELRLDNARLRGLIKGAEWNGGLESGSCDSGCPWCGVELETHPSNQRPHDVDCPAFTPDGAVR